MGWKWPGIFHAGVPRAGLSHLHSEPQLSHLFCLGLSAWAWGGATPGLTITFSSYSNYWPCTLPFCALLVAG